MKNLHGNLIVSLLVASLCSTAYSSPPDSQAERVIGYQRSGGYAGVNEQYNVLGNGHVSTNKQCEWRVDAEQLELLVQRIEVLGFYDLAAKYVPKNACCDRFSYQLTVSTNDKKHTVSVVGGDPRVPEQFWEMLKLVQQFLDIIPETTHR